MENVEFNSLNEEEMKKIEGGVVGFLAGIAAGWIVGEVLQGIYQYQKEGC